MRVASGKKTPVPQPSPKAAERRHSIDVVLKETWGPGRKLAVPDWRADVEARYGVPIAATVGPGWRGICEDLFRVLWDLTALRRLEEHEGGLQVRLIDQDSKVPMDMQYQVMRARGRSFRTCCRCGDYGQLRSRGPRQETTCSACDDKLRKEDADGRWPASQ